MVTIGIIFQSLKIFDIIFWVIKMFLISTKGRYALRVMLDLAAQDAEKIISLEEISARQGISRKYLETIINILVQNGLLKGKRGKSGGYRLTRQPSEYTVGEILDLTEITLSAVECLSKENNTCERKSQCLTLPLWERFNKMAHDFFYSVTLQDILDEKIAVS